MFWTFLFLSIKFWEKPTLWWQATCFRETILGKAKGTSTLYRFYPARVISTTYTVTRGQWLLAKLIKRQIEPHKEEEKKWASLSSHLNHKFINIEGMKSWKSSNPTAMFYRWRRQGTQLGMHPSSYRADTRAKAFELKTQTSIQFSISPKRLGLRVSQALQLRCHFLPHLKEAGRKRQK